jgi:hypothetical protein
MMKYQKPISLLVGFIIFLSIVAASYGIFSSQGQGESEYKSIFGETVSIYGKGLYQHDSVPIAAQAIAQDYVTLFLGIPLLLFSLFFARKGLLKGRLVLTGTLGYFLYTYVSYSFLSMYNSFFLIYVLLMSACFFAFTLAIMSFDKPMVPRYFDKKLPVTFIGCFLLFVSVIFTLMWLGKVAPTLMKEVPPVGLEHYTTLVIQALDLGFVIPTSILAAILLMKRKPYGYLLASVMIIKDITLLTALSAMVVLQMLAGMKGMFVMLAIVVLFNLIVIYCMYLIMKNTKEPGIKGAANISA